MWKLATTSKGSSIMNDPVVIDGNARACSRIAAIRFPSRFKKRDDLSPNCRVSDVPMYPLFAEWRLYVHKNTEQACSMIRQFRVWR